MHEKEGKNQKAGDAGEEGRLHGYKLQNSSNGQLPIGERGINSKFGPSNSQSSGIHSSTVFQFRRCGEKLNCNWVNWGIQTARLG